MLRAGLLGVFLVLIAVRFASAATGRLEAAISEKAGGKVPCRVHLAVDGRPVYAPDLPRFERDSHFSCPGEFAVDLPAGKASIRIERGPEYEPLAAEIAVEAGSTHKRTFELRRWIDMNARTWYSGDLHVHRPVKDMPLLLRAEDLNLAPVLTHWNARHEEVARPYLVEAAEGEHASSRPRCFHQLAQEDERAGGAILLFNLAEPILLKHVTRHAPSGLAYHQAALRQKAFVEVEKPFWWEAPVHVALGKADTMGIVCNHFHRTGLLAGEAWGRARDQGQYPGPMGFAHHVMDLYYRYLNLGYRLSASAGSASGVLRNPLGYNRVYVRLEQFSYAAWFDALREGRNFVTNGPMLFVTVNGRHPGERFDVPADGRLEAAVDLEVLDRDPLAKAEIVLGGKVIATLRPGGDDPRRIVARHVVTIDRSTWLAVRAFEPLRDSVVRFAHTSPFYVTVAGRRPRDPEAGRFYVKWLDELIAKWEQLRSQAKDPAGLDAVLETYRQARASYRQMSE